MRTHIFITIVTGLISVCTGAIETAEPLSKLSLTDEVKHPSDTKDLEASASDRTFLIGRDYGYGSGGYGGGYGTYPPIGVGSIYGPTGTSYYNRGGNGLNSIYRGYQTGNGYGGITGGGNTGWGYYGSGGYGSGGLGSYGGYGSTGLGYGTYDDSYAGHGGHGYNRWNNLDGYHGSTIGSGYGGYGGSGYGNSGYGVSTYPYGYRGSGSGIDSGYSGYPTGYRGYS